MYTYKAKLNKVIDGDTVNLTIDLGFRMTMTANCRMAGINAPEMDTEEGKAAKIALMYMLPIELTIISTGLDKYGRPIVQLTDGKTDFNQKMIDNGNAVKY